MHYLIKKVYKRRNIEIFRKVTGNVCLWTHIMTALMTNENQEHLKI